MSGPKRRTMHGALALIAMAGVVGPTMAQLTQPERRDRVQNRDREQTQERGVEALERRQKVLDEAVENGKISRERADEMMVRMKEGLERQTRDRQPERETDRAQATRDRMGSDALPAQLNKLFDLQDAQHAEVNKLVRELRAKQREVMMEMRGAMSGARPDARGDARGGGESNAKRGQGGETRDADARGKDARDGDGAARRGPDVDSQGKELRPPRDREARGDRDARGGGEVRGGEATDRKRPEADAPLRGPRVRGEGEAGGGERDAMGGDRARGVGQMSEEQRHEMMSGLREKLEPINRAFARDLIGVVGKEHGAKLRENWEKLDVMPPMVTRMMEAEKSARDAKGAKGKKGEAKERQAKPGAEGEDARTPRDGEKKKGPRGGKGGRDGG